jgi:hypothetical protein
MEGGLHSSSRARTLAVEQASALGKICRSSQPLSETCHATTSLENAHFRRSRTRSNEDGVADHFFIFFRGDEVPYFRCIGFNSSRKQAIFVDKLHSAALALWAFLPIISKGFRSVFGGR